MSLVPAVEPAALPGVRLWLRRLLDDLRRGRSCLCLLPDVHFTPRDAPAEALLGELLHELGDFLLVPPAERDHVTRVPPPRVSHGAPWAGTGPLLDYDDGLSDFGPHVAPTARIPAAREAVRPPASSVAELLERLAKELHSHADGRSPADEADNVLARLTGDPAVPGDGRVIVVRAWRETVPAAATDVLRRLAAAAKEAGLPPARRPRMLVVAAPSGLPAELPDQIAREDAAVHWWWGAHGRLDTATVVSVARPRPLGPAAHHRLLDAVAQATVVEVCGPFIDVAEKLAACWDGVPETLLEQVRHAAGAAGASEPATRGEWSRRSPLQPDASLRPGWNRGVLEAWDGLLRPHPGCEADLECAVATRMWLAQNRVLLPLLDDAREEFTEVIRRRSRLPPGHLAGQYRPRPAGTAATASDTAAGTLMGMELGAMWAAHVNSQVRLTRPEADRLRVLWDARNRLAHRTALDGARLKRLVTELCR